MLLGLFNFKAKLAGLSAESRFMTETYLRRHPEDRPEEATGSPVRRAPASEAYPKWQSDLDRLAGRQAPKPGTRRVMSIERYIETEPDLIHEPGVARYVD